MRLTITNNRTFAPLTLDLTNYLDVQDGEGMDPYDPAFTNKVISHSLLKEGGVLALEDLHAKELVYPVRLSTVNASSLATLIQQINQVLNSPGATCSWQDDGMSQPTVFDLISGQLDIKYSYRKAQRSWTDATLRIFTQPLGRSPAIRPFAAASGFGPLLMISPYASGGANVLTPTASGGFLGTQQPGGGVSYISSPSLAGDAPALLQISYVGPMPNTATNAGCIPYTAVSLLPDPLYRPLITTPELYNQAFNWAQLFDQNAVASSYLRITAGSYVNGGFSFAPLPIPSDARVDPTLEWAGAHRLFAIARAQGAPAYLQTQGNAMVPIPTAATINPGDWSLYDLGTFTIRASEPPIQNVTLYGALVGAASLDVTALVMLPDNSTWFFNAGRITPSQYGFAPGVVRVTPLIGASSPYTNTLILDDVLGDQFVYSGQSQTFAPSPLGSVASSARVTQYTRGLVPRPDPKYGVPIFAILGVGQNFTPDEGGLQGPEASWANPQTYGTMAQVNVLERTRYVFP